MIPLERERTTATVKAKYRDPDRIDNGVELVEKFMTGTNTFYKNGFWKLAKDQLIAESFGKCAFCETPTTAAYYGDVEHFRPKQRQKYWWLAYCFDNYLFSCRICNGFKSDQFPTKGTQLPAPSLPASPTNAQLRAISENMTPDPLNVPKRDDFDDACLDEVAVLPNPYQEDPWQLFKWEVIEPLKEVTVTHRTLADREFVEPTIDILRLNRDVLKGQRYLTFVTLNSFKILFEMTSGAAKTIAEDALKDMMEEQRAYCGMARYFVSEVWNLNIPVPA